MGDDEIPASKVVSFDDLSHGLEIWLEDARENSSFCQYETPLHELLLKLAVDNIKEG